MSQHSPDNAAGEGYERPTEAELQSADPILKAGTTKGVKLMMEIGEAVQAMSQQDRIYYFSAMLRVPVECMKASIGTEAAMAMLDAAKEHLTDG